MLTNRPPRTTPPLAPPPIAAASGQLDSCQLVPPPVEGPPVEGQVGAPSTDPANSSSENHIDHLNLVPCWLVSMVLHTAAMIIAGLIPVFDLVHDEPVELALVPIEDLVDVDDKLLDELLDDAIVEPEIERAIDETDPVENPDLNEPKTRLDLSSTDDALARALLFDDPLTDRVLFQQIRDGNPDGRSAGDELAGRNRASRGYLVRKGGGNDASERAVVLSLNGLSHIRPKMAAGRSITCMGINAGIVAAIRAIRAGRAWAQRPWRCCRF